MWETDLDLQCQCCLDQRMALLASKVILQRGKEVSDHGNTPGPPKDLLPLSPPHIIHICVMLWEPKYSESADRNKMSVILSKATSFNAAF